MTLCNMTVEAGARAALIAPDAVPDAYVTAHAQQLRGETLAAARAYWSTLRSDDDAAFHVEHAFDAADIAPFVTWGTSPDQAMPVTGRVPDPQAEPDTRARLALEELKRVGAFKRSALVVVTPTGTGWIDPAAMDAVEYLLHGDVASVAIQYSYLSSPLSLLAQPDCICMA
ncbi:hypothetical protein G6F50_015685 [Rhizopus delemar]|uniref:Alpha/beta-hydrolase catalytic domain-containing protein n=1 Tax=Rhizopus delemar TaxID=936053 RepID=A0A9P7C3C4_9FUNG|nr:hypothetical protein G6F50_015685 [Rhizopus delemar]